MLTFLTAHAYDRVIRTSLFMLRYIRYARYGFKETIAEYCLGMLCDRKYLCYYSVSKTQFDGYLTYMSDID